MTKNITPRRALSPNFPKIIRAHDDVGLRRLLTRRVSNSTDSSNGILIVRSSRPEDDKWSTFRELSADGLVDRVSAHTGLKVDQAFLFYDDTKSAALTEGSRTIVERHTMIPEDPDKLSGRRCIVYGFDPKSGGRLADMASTIVEHGGTPLFCYAPHSIDFTGPSVQLVLKPKARKPLLPSVKIDESKYYLGPLFKLVKSFHKRARDLGQDMTLDEAAKRLHASMMMIGLPLPALTGGEAKNLRGHIQGAPDQVFAENFIENGSGPRPT